MFNPDFKDLLRLFAENSVDYVVVGAYAMAAHGYVRATGDIDLFVEPSLENARAVYASLVAFGATRRLPDGPRTDLIWNYSGRPTKPTIELSPGARR